MPQLPAATLPTVLPDRAGGAYRSNDVNPSAFGAGVGQAQSRLGQASDEFGGAAAQAALMFQKDTNETAVDEHNTKWQSDVVRPLLMGPDGFYSKQGKDAFEAMTPTAQALEKSRTDYSKALANPQQQRMFDYMTRRMADRELYGMSMHAAKENRVWQEGVNKGAITNEVNNSATFWNDNVRFAEGLGNIKLLAEKEARNKGYSPDSEATKATVTHYQSEAWQARIHSVMAQDPDVARDLFDQNADSIDAPHRAQLDAQITNHQYTKLMRVTGEENRVAAAAAKALHTTQTTNTSKLFSDVLKNKPISDATLADMVGSQQISPAQVDTVLALQKAKRGGNVDDKGEVVIALHQMLNNPNIDPEQMVGSIKEALHVGGISPATAGTLVDAAFKKDNRGETAIARASLNVLKTVTGTHNIEKGLVDLTNQAGRDQAQLSAQMLNEWNQRVVVGKEDPLTVKEDMLPRYQPHNMPPVEWPTPKFGRITNIDEVNDVAGRTKAAFEKGTITEQEYRQQGTMLLNYAKFYADLKERQLAAQAAIVKAAPTGKSGKIVGVKQNE